MANDDRIYAAYLGEMGEEFQHQTKERISWILQQIENKRTVLDIGCSQGIVSILSAEQGAVVKGIEIQEENVTFAQQLVVDKYAHLQDKITFIHSDFMEYDTSEKFDAIIITEVIEHLNDAEKFLKHASKYLHEDGVVVITTPFGFCDHPDHVYTFFLSSFWQLVSSAFCITNIYYGGNWMGCIARQQKFGTDNFILNQKAYEAEEANFLYIQKNLQKRNSRLYTSLQESNAKYRESCNSYEKLKSWRENDIQKNAFLTAQLNDITLEKDNALKEISQLKEELKSVSIAQKSTDQEMERINIQFRNYAIEKQMLIELVQAQDNYEQVMLRAKRTIQKQQRELQMLRAENEIYKKRWEKLENKWYGRFALKCYYKLKDWNILK